MNRLRTAPLRRQTLLLAAALLLIGQAVFGPAMTARASLFGPGDLAGSIPICHASAPDDGENGNPAAPRERDTDCVLCIVCHALGTVAVLPNPAADEPAPPASLVSRSATLPPARRSPGRLFLAASYPTGPPPPGLT